MIIFTIRTSTNIYSLLIEYFSQTPYNRIIQIHIKLRRHNSFIFARFLINVSNLAGRERSPNFRYIAKRRILSNRESIRAFRYFVRHISLRKFISGEIMKKTVVLLAVLTALCTLSISALAQTEVTFWTLNTRQEAVGPIVEAFNAANPDIKVIPSFFDTDGIKDACKIAASSGTIWASSISILSAEIGRASCRERV